MKTKIIPLDKTLTTTLPLTLEIAEAEGKVQVFVEKLGAINVKPNGANGFKSEFYFVLPGVYHVTVKDQKSTQHLSLDIQQQVYLDFGREFGFFLLLFLLVMMGIILWVKKIMSSKTS